jgi:hypothetical protein
MDQDRDVAGEGVATGIRGRGSKTCQLGLGIVILDA